MARTILFVCTGNTCRSVMAETILRHLLQQRTEKLPFQVSSAGLAAVEGSPPTEKTEKVLGEEGFQATNHSSRRLQRELIEGADLILTMTGAHKERVEDLLEQEGLSREVYTLKEFASSRERERKKRRLRELKQRMAREEDTASEEEILALEEALFDLDIQDPFGGSLESYRFSLQEIREALEALVEKLLEMEDN